MAESEVAGKTHEPKPPARRRPWLVLRLLIALGGSFFYVFGVLPLFFFPEAFALHAGCVGTLLALWGGRPRFRGKVTLTAILTWMFLACLIALGYFRVQYGETFFVKEIEEIRLQRLGVGRDSWRHLPPIGLEEPDDAIGIDCRQTVRRDADSCRRVLSLVRERRPGWSRGVAALCMVAGLDSPRQLQCAQMHACGNPFLTPLGYDSFSSLRSVLGMERAALELAEEKRSEVLGAWDRGIPEFEWAREANASR